MSTRNRRHNTVSHNRLQGRRDEPEGLTFSGPTLYVGPKTLIAIVKIVCAAVLLFLTFKA